MRPRWFSSLPIQFQSRVKQKMSGENNNTPKWDIESTNPNLIDALHEELSTITDPELGFSIIDLGLVRNIALDLDKVKVTMILTTPFCPYGPAMMEATRFRIESTINIKTETEYGDEVWNPDMMNEELREDNWGF